MHWEVQVWAGGATHRKQTLSALPQLLCPTPEDGGRSWQLLEVQSLGWRLTVFN